MVNMSTDIIKKCPFCGGEAEVCGYYFIQCTKCGSSTLTHTNREEAIKAWNTRKPMERIVERLGKIKDIAWDEEYQIVCDVIEIVKEVGGMDDKGRIL